MERQISVFEPQEINGQIVEPICIPSENTALAHTVAGATNLLWFAFHLALAEGNIGHCKAISQMLQVVVDGEVNEEFKNELEAAIDLLDKEQNDDTEGDDEN
jgi:hypothetical protein